jgi:hypothetical protein
MKNLFFIFIFFGIKISALTGQPFSISGSFIYNNDASNPMDNMKVVLILNGIPIDSTTTSETGYYQFTGLTVKSCNIESKLRIDNKKE